MSQYVRRWLVALLVVAPAMFVLVPAAQLLFFGLAGPHANDPFWVHVLGMAGFYGGYALLTGTLASLLHTWLIRLLSRPTRATQILLAVVIGVLSLLPQGLMFGLGYYAANLVAGTSAGALYGLLVTWRGAGSPELREPAQTI
jgi:hypothetical protein